MYSDTKNIKHNLQSYRSLTLFCNYTSSSKENCEAYRLITIITQAADILRLIPMHGEIYYKIIYYNYLSPEIYNYTFEIIEALKNDSIFLSQRTYFRYKSKALAILSRIIEIAF